MSSAALTAFRHRDFALFWSSLVAEALALQMAFVAIGWQVYAVRSDGLQLSVLEVEGSRIMKLEVEFGTDDETPTDEPAAA